MTAFQYIAGKISSGFLIMTAALVIMNIVFIILCYATAVKSGFAMNILDFVQNSILYVLPNILMICCVYAVTALLFKNPLPAVPALVLYIIYSNMLTWDSKGQCHARPFSIMVRFPGNFFETEGLDVTAAPAFNERYQVCLGDTIVFRDDSYEIVKSLRGRVKQYVVSNGTVLAQTKKLRLSGLGELMDGIFLSEELGAEKPNAAFFDQVFEAIEETAGKRF